MKLENSAMNWAEAGVALVLAVTFVVALLGGMYYLALL